MFHFKRFDLEHERSTLKIGTDAVLLAALTRAETDFHVLDIGCGCGVIAFCIAQKLVDNHVLPDIYGIDVDAVSIEEAQSNADRFPLQPKPRFIFQRNRLQDFADGYNGHRFDLIVCNPPYFHDSLKPLDKNRLQSKHGDGQLSFQELVDGVDELLSDDGRFSFILPPSEMVDFHKLAIQKWHCWSSVHIRPTTNKPVFRIVREYGRVPQEEKESHFSIRDASLHYSSEYLGLVEPYLTIR